MLTRLSAVVAVVAVVAVAACGRIGFGGLSDDATGDGAGAPPAGFVISRTQLTMFASFSWIALDVDWERSLAYVGTRESGRCVAVVDFADEAAPSIARWIGEPGTTCLEVALLDAERLAVISLSDGRLRVWRLGDPRSAAPTLVAQQAIASPRHFWVDRSGALPRLLVTAPPSPGLVEVEVGSTGLSVIASWPGTCSDAYQAVVATGNQVVVACHVNNSPIEILDRNGLGMIASLPNNGPGDTGSWTATALADGRAVVLGWANVVVRSGAIVTRWQTTDAYRHVIPAGPDTVWAARSDGSIEVLSLATDGVARVVGRSSHGAGRETYALRLAPGGQRGIAVNNRGHFIVFDPTRIEAVDMIYP